MANILRKIIENDKGEIKKLEKTAKKVESYADAMAALSDEELQAKTEEFKKRYQSCLSAMRTAFTVPLPVLIWKARSMWSSQEARCV